eukprot:5909878-Prymnesium_polylepis.1
MLVPPKGHAPPPLRLTASRLRPTASQVRALSYCNLMMLDHADFQRVVKRNLGSMTSKFVKMSGVSTDCKANSRMEQARL